MSDQYQPSQPDDQLQADQEALARRLRAAMGSVRPSDDFVSQLREQVRREIETPPADAKQPQSRRVLTFPRLLKLGAGLGAAAAVVIVASVLLLTGGSTHASPPEKVAFVHLKNLTRCKTFRETSDANELCAYLEKHVRHRPILPDCPRLSLVGACSKTARRFASSYLTRIPEGEVSVIICRETPQQLEFTHTGDGDTDYWLCAYERDRMLARRLGDETYVVVGRAGEIPVEKLETILSSIVSRAKPATSQTGQ